MDSHCRYVGALGYETSGNLDNVCYKTGSRELPCDAVALKRSHRHVVSGEASLRRVAQLLALKSADAARTHATPSQQHRQWEVVWEVSVRL